MHRHENEEIKDRFRTSLQALNDYFATLAKTDPKKLDQRFDSCQKINEKIESLAYKNVNAKKLEEKMIEDKKDVGEKFLDLLSGIMGRENKEDKEEVRKKLPINADEILKVSLNDIVKLCNEAAVTYQGKGGAQKYTTILNNLAVAIESEIHKPASTSQLLNTVWKELREKKFLDVRANVLKLSNDIKDEYIPVIEFEIKHQGGRFFKKTVDVRLSNAKKDIAEDLQQALQAFITDDTAQNKPAVAGFKNETRLANAVARADAEHKEVLRGSSGTEGRLGELITEAKNILKQYYPVEYAKAKHELRPDISNQPSL